MSLIELALTEAGSTTRGPRRPARRTQWGDHVGHTPALGTASAGVLARATPAQASAAAIRTGEGSAVIARFVAWASAMA